MEAVVALADGAGGRVARSHGGTQALQAYPAVDAGGAEAAHRAAVRIEARRGGVVKRQQPDGRGRRADGGAHHLRRRQVVRVRPRLIPCLVAAAMEVLRRGLSQDREPPGRALEELEEGPLLMLP